MEMALLVRFLKGTKDSVWWKNEDDISRAVLVWKSTGKRPRGRPRKRLLDVVEEDRDRMGVQEWRIRSGSKK